MVGDCIIAHFGPPFYETKPGERLANAIRCARGDPGHDAAAARAARASRCCAASEVGVATGLNLCPLFVGRFGPNGNFTGFSRGMNNTARLQGCAVRDEILVMAEAIPALGEASRLRLRPRALGQVKNVAEPLRFRALV